MDYRFLKSFLYVADRLHFARAAHDLRITPAALSRQIRLLEDSLQTQLFIRSPKQVVLTEAGEELLGKLTPFDHWLNDKFFHQSQPVRIGCISPFLVEVIPKLIQELPNVHFKITQGSPSFLREKLEDGSIDICLFNKDIQSDTISSRKLSEE